MNFGFCQWFLVENSFPVDCVSSSYVLASSIRYMKRLAGEMSPSAGLNFSDGYQATAVCKAVTSGGTFLTYGKELPKYVAYEGSARKPVEWSTFIKEKKMKVLKM